MRKPTALLLVLLTLTLYFVRPDVSHAVSSYEISDGSVRALWSLENTTDDSGNGYTLTNNNTVDFVAGKLNNAASTTRALTQYLDIASDIGITGGSVGIALWVKINAQPAEGNGGGNPNNYWLFQQGDDGVDVNYAIVYWDNAGTYYVDFNRGRDGVADCNTTITQTLTTGTYFHIILNYDSGTQVVTPYINGVAKTTATSCTGNGTGSNNEIVTIGAWKRSGTTPYTLTTANYDEVVVLNRPFTSDEISGMYNGGTGAEVCITVGCGTPAPAAQITRCIRGIGISRQCTSR